MSQQSAIVIGAGIVGLATARALSLRGYSVTVIERTEKAVGASIRNFGMVWPIGQPDGKLYDRAMRSRQIWKEIADSVGLWYEEAGSLHVAAETDEWQVLQELHHHFSGNGRATQLLSPEQIGQRFSGIHTGALLGGLYSDTELIVDPREAISSIPAYLEEYLGVTFLWQKQVNRVEAGKVYLGQEVLQADLVCICSGADFETLYPEVFANTQITKCKLQMLRYLSDKADQRIGTSVCGGLSLIHYHSFQSAPSLPALKKRYETEMAEYLKWGIHVMVSQNSSGELTVGDSHEYGHTLDPFDRAEVNRLIMDYLERFMITEDWKLVQSWNGVYPKMTNGQTEVFLNPEPGVYILNGLGGAGMTLSFGLAEEFVAGLS
ncbi:MAG: TIGR03364 family FAD-dependent oxidoreductase [Chitinophagaceae bacterium]|nr:TIGR03364 family FAD-dependent oxidoreductase [Chitinophagaceae bacterium]MCA6454254.1 TIGR03364 family FAD-dependent oxidoreductase [Chitinophagaceae bacterium]MCA6455514.1 TIGR03364 family FAD-dependent oxidoreductase [Chitinophagaceae bacterium]MCA6460692.1 TIGR03364 family FAD-dependent oxidoreductase [Chitinophagaceae bacterium]MCA6464908.1 TIGR03364 family FAD-dependent oxidoreductase [Chitinophagaceae bacterium]